MTESKGALRLDELAYELEKAKQMEDSARRQRVAIEEQLAQLAGTKDEGSHTAKGEYYKVTTVAGFTRTLNPDKWEHVKKRIPESISANVVRTKLEVDTKQLKSLQQFDPEHYRIVAEAITTKPKKVGVRLQRLEVK